MCFTCFCHGAVLLSVTRIDLSDVCLDAMVATWIVCLSPASAEDSLAYFDWTPRGSLPDPAGRAARIQFQSFQI